MTVPQCSTLSRSARIRAARQHLLQPRPAVPAPKASPRPDPRWINLGTDIATGERMYFRWGFRDLLHRGLVDVVQPDIVHCGGISETRRIAAMAETEHVKFAPHDPNGPIAVAASVHVCAAAPNFLILETARDMPWHDRVQKPPLKIKDGYFELPTKPGLGVELDEKVIASRPYEDLSRRSRGSWNALDGSPEDV